MVYEKIRITSMVFEHKVSGKVSKSGKPRMRSLLMSKKRFIIRLYCIHEARMLMYIGILMKFPIN